MIDLTRNKGFCNYTISIGRRMAKYIWDPDQSTTMGQHPKVAKNIALTCVALYIFLRQHLWTAEPY